MLAPCLFFVCSECSAGISLRMGTKYLPTDKDRKDGKRFLQKHHAQSKFIRTSGTAPTRKAKKK